VALVGLLVDLTQHALLYQHEVNLYFREEDPEQNEALNDHTARYGEHAERKLSGEVQSERKREGLECQLVQLPCWILNLQPSRRLAVRFWCVVSAEKRSCSTPVLLAREKIERLVSACCEQTLTGTFLSGRCEVEGRRDRVITCDNLNTDEVKNVLLPDTRITSRAPAPLRTSTCEWAVRHQHCCYQM
jgi:hypothetical protein